jgi:hypothetical protein
MDSMDDHHQPTNIGFVLRDNLQYRKPPIFDGKKHCFLYIFPRKPIQ